MTGDGLDDGLAEFGRSGTAVLHQESQKIANAGEIRTIEDRTPLAFRRHQPGMVENLEMGRQGVLNRTKPRSDFTGRQPLGAGAYQKAKHIEPRFLAECRKRS
jgi:hypothetical protein